MGRLIIGKFYVNIKSTQSIHWHLALKYSIQKKENPAKARFLLYEVNTILKIN